MKSKVRLVSVLTFCLFVAACNTTKLSDDPNKHISSDPLNKLNRSVYSFNMAADKAILRPVARTYGKVVPKPAKKGVKHFFANLREPFNVVHNLLQGKFDRALASTYRFAVNSTVGIFGLFDVAKKLDVEPAHEDLGQTLAAWGVKPGPYIMLPILGPTNLRDGFGRVGDSFAYYPIGELTESEGTRLGLGALDVVAFRETLLSTDSVLEAQLDQYGFFKQAYEQSRINEIYDGSPPEAEELDLDF